MRRWKIFLRYRSWWYKRGHRPKRGTLLYSPSLDMIYAFRGDAMIVPPQAWLSTNKAVREMKEVNESGVPSSQLYGDRDKHAPDCDQVVRAKMSGVGCPCGSRWFCL